MHEFLALGFAVSGVLRQLLGVSMAIVSMDSEPAPPSVILAVVRAPPDHLTDLERQMRQRELYILQKKPLELTLEAMKGWFSEAPSDAPDMESTGYVLQGADAGAAWEEIAKEVGGSVCGVGPESDLRSLFPSVVLDKYLLEPAWTSQYLARLESPLRAGLEQVCKDKPEDPVQFLADFLEKSLKQT